LDYADQRYYANNFGRFMSPDPYKASGGTKSPGSWNRYTYVQGEPIDRTDPSGLYFTDCADCVPARCSIPPDAFSGVEPDPNADCPDEAFGEPTVRPIEPPCWQDLGKIFQTFDDIGRNITEILALNDPGISASKLIALNTLIDTDVATEIATTFGSGLIGQPGPDYVGGHFNLYISTSSLQTTLGSDFTNFQSIFGGSLDGTRQPVAVFGNKEQSQYTLHSKEIDSNSTFQFHFDKYNPFPLWKFGVVPHFFAEVLGGHAGTPCLDPAWSAAKQ
jgi:uncharacterized protein RhaS with RHS repeats